MIRWSSTAVVIALAVVAGAVSYWHGHEVVVRYGETGFTAWLIPATPDGIVYAASMVLLDASRRGGRGHWLAWVALGLGVLATLAVNVLHGWDHGVIGAALGAFPAVALALAFELLMMLMRSAGTPQAATVPAEVRDPGSGRILPDTSVPGRVHPAAAAPGTLRTDRDRSGTVRVDDAAAAACVPALAGGQVQLAPGNGPDQVADTGSFGVVSDRSASDQVRQVSDAPADVPEPVELHLKAIQTYAPLVAKGEVPAVRRIKRELRCGQPNAERVRAYLSEYAPA